MQKNIYILTISNNKHNNYNSNNNDLKRWAKSQIGKEINFDLNKKLVRFITHLKNTSTTRQTVKKKEKKGIYNACHWLLSQEWIDRRYWSPL